MNNKLKAIKGTAFHSPTYGKIECLEDVLIIFNKMGIIESVLLPSDKEYFTKLDSYRKANELLELKKGEYILPGFIDLHIHAPQWAQSGLALDDELSDWLMKFTFPLEAKYEDINFAKEVYNDLVETLLSRGTTTAMYFATIHNEASLELAKICAKKGQRGFVGKVVMDDKNMNPQFYRDNSTEEAIKNTEKFILDVKKIAKDTLQGVYPVITPRFIPSCTDKALYALGDLSKKYNTHIQSHCSESDWEHNFVKERCMKTDAFALNKFGLLGEKSVMAHCNFLDEKDGEVFAKTGTSVCHCPISNAYFANGVLPVQRLKNQGVNISLGTDISGGYSPSLYDNIRQTVISSRMLNDGVNTNLSPEKRGVSDSRVSVAQAFYLATKGGADAVNLPLGLFQKGYICDFQIINTNNNLGIFNDLKDKTHILQKILYLSTKENISEVWIQGKCVYKIKGGFNGINKEK